MKALKTIFAILLLIAIIPCVIYLATYTSSMRAICDAMSANLDMGVSFASVYPKIYNTANSNATLMLAVFPLFISAAVVGLSMKKKYYGSLIAGILPLIALVWLVISTCTMAALRDDVLVKYFDYVDGYYTAVYAGTLRKFTASIILPTLGYLIIGIIETRKYIVRKKSGLPAEEEKPSSVATDTNVNSSNSDNQPNSVATELKQLKELLDMGIITAEEFDAKKKQLLGLPTTYSTPATPQSIGKCIICGRENVPIESIEVVVAGMSRKRTMCAECAAKYK